jgi:hypothetical protein
LLSGSSDGGVYWAENIAGKGKPPVLRPFRPLIPPRLPTKDGQSLRECDLTGPTRAPRVWVNDVNSDGKLEILVGDCVTLLSPAKGVSVTEFKKKLAEWQDAFKAESSALNAPAGDAKAQAKAREELDRLYCQRAELMNEEMTGYVWLYLQK